MHSFFTINQSVLFLFQLLTSLNLKTLNRDGIKSIADIEVNMNLYYFE